MFGLALVLFATTIVWTVRVKRSIGSLMGVLGLVFIVDGWVMGVEGFSPNDDVLTIISSFLFGVGWFGYTSSPG